MFAALSIIIVIIFQKTYKQIENTNRVGWRVCCEKCRDMKNPNFRLLQQKIFNNPLGPGCQSYSNFFSQKNLKINCK